MTTVHVIKIEPYFITFYSVNMQPNENVTQVNRNTLQKVSVVYDKYWLSYLSKTMGPILLHSL